MSTWMFPSLAEALAGLLPREEKSVIVSSNSWDVRYSVTTLAISGFRPFTIENTGGWVSGGSPAIVSGFGGALIRDIGVDPKAFWVVTDKLSVQDIENEAFKLGARVMSIASYQLYGEPRKWAAILVGNTAGLKWYLWADTTPADITSKLKANNARLIDLRPTQPINGNEYNYTAVAIDNSGLNHHNFVWYHNRTTQQVVDLVKQTGFRLVHLATEFGTAQTGDTSCVILQENPSRLNWWWFADSDFNDIDQFANASHMRVICVARIHSVLNHYSAVLLQNGA